MQKSHRMTWTDSGWSRYYKQWIKLGRALWLRKVVLFSLAHGWRTLCFLLSPPHMHYMRVCIVYIRWCRRALRGWECVSIEHADVSRWIIMAQHNGRPHEARVFDITIWIRMKKTVHIVLSFFGFPYTLFCVVDFESVTHLCYDRMVSILADDISGPYFDWESGEKSQHSPTHTHTHTQSCRAE